MSHATTPITTPALPRPRGWRRLLQVPTPAIFALCLAVAVAAIWRQGRIGELGELTEQLSGATIAGLLLLYAAGPLLQCVRWNALVRMVGGASNLITASQVFLTSIVVNYAAPIGLAVPTRTALTTRDLGLPLARSGAVVLWEAILDLGALGLASAFWLVLGDIDVLRAALPKNGSLWALIAAVAAGGIAISMLALWKRPTLREKIQHGLREMAAAPLRNPGALALAALSTAGFWAIQVIVFDALL
ncbi:MAG: lysylphosphatidylglycerol synthase domain-containing protein, partial [Thermomicrobiales bacterium]